MLQSCVYSASSFATLAEAPSAAFALRCIVSGVASVEGCTLFAVSPLRAEVGNTIKQRTPGTPFVVALTALASSPEKKNGSNRRFLTSD